MHDQYITPEPLASALITIDVQNDFARAGSRAYIPGTADVVPAISRALDAYRDARRPIIHVVRLYSADGSNADLCRRTLIEGGAEIARPGSDGAELADALKPDPSVTLDAHALLAGEFQQLSDHEWVLYKSRWSAFHRTTLDAKLHGLDVTSIVVTGCNFPNCPRATIYDASSRDYRILVVEDAISGFNDQGRMEMGSIGVKMVKASELHSWLIGERTAV